jgi:hypothetical protein
LDDNGQGWNASLDCINHQNLSAQVWNCKNFILPHTIDESHFKDNPVGNATIIDGSRSEKNLQIDIQK